MSEPRRAAEYKGLPKGYIVKFLTAAQTAEGLAEIAATVSAAVAKALDVGEAGGTGEHSTEHEVILCPSVRDWEALS